MESRDFDFRERYERAVDEWVIHGRAGLALDKINELLLENPRSLDCWKTRSGILLELKQPREALESVDRSIALAPDDFANYAEKAFIYAFALHDLRGAEEFGNVAYSLLPDRARDGNDASQGENVFSVLLWIAAKKRDAAAFARLQRECVERGFEAVAGRLSTLSFVDGF